MKKWGWLLGLAVVFALTTASWAEEGQEAVSKVVTPSDAATEAAPAADGTAAAPVENAVEPPAADNLEFVSGEVSASDEAAKTITVKLYGEGDAQATEKVLTVKVDEATDITDGEKDRDLKSLTAGTEVDVEYDPATTKATYIFVY
jgi:hypothetical protein